MIIKWIKKHRAMTVLLFIFLYLVIGAAAPFYHYKPVSGITKANTSASAFYQDGPVSYTHLTPPSISFCCQVISQ